MKQRIICKSLVVAVIILFIGVGIQPVFADNPIKPTSSGNTLYVGGSGEGNYTSIQDAIDNASDGDTVFVYSGNYNGLVRIKKSINLIGEDRNSTIISGPNTRIWIEDTNNVNIQSFTIMDGLDNLIEVRRCSNCTVYNNFIQNDGSEFFRDGVFIIRSSKIKIIKNYINCDRISIDIRLSKNCFIENNKFGGTEKWNVFTVGIYIYESRNIRTIHNNITRCYTGIDIIWSKPVYVIQNNLHCNVLKVHFNSDRLFSTIWNSNYWGKDTIFPKIIRGRLSIIKTNFVFPEISFRWFNIDWNPAQEPYEI